MYIGKLLLSTTDVHKCILIYFNILCCKFCEYIENIVCYEYVYW